MAVTLSHYRFGIDELAESTHGWHAAEDANPASGAIALDTNFLLRFTLQCDGTAQSNVDSEFQYRRNGGTWTNITTSSTFVRAVAVTPLTNGGNCTKRLGGTGTFESTGAGQTEDGTSGGTANDIVANGNSETECGLILRSADIVGGDVIEFRLTRDGGTLLDTYSVVPTLLIPTDGDVTKTLGALTSSATATSDINGSVSKTLGALTSAATGAVDVVGALSQTLDALTLDADGTAGLPEILGGLAITFDDLVGDATATSDIAAALSSTLGAVTSTAAGTVAIVGGTTATLGAATLAATGAVDIAGAFSATLGAVTCAASGAVAITGLAGFVLDALTCDSGASVDAAGVVNATLGAVSCIASGAVGEQIEGSLAATLEALALAATAASDVSAALAQTLAAVTLVASNVPEYAPPSYATGGALSVDAILRSSLSRATHTFFGKLADD